MSSFELQQHFGSMRQTAKALSVSVASISRWSKRLYPLQRKPSTTPSVAPVIRDIVRTRLNVAPCTTCIELRNHVFQTTQMLLMSKSLVLNVIHSLGFSYKRVKKRGMPSDLGRTSLRVNVPDN